MASRGTSELRLAVVTSHPIQYQAPWFRGLARECALHVYFAHRQSRSDQALAGYGVEFDWDLDLTDGYAHEFLTNVAKDRNVYSFSGCDTPQLAELICRERFDAVIVTGWYLKSYWQAIWAAKRAHLPVLVRGDSQLATRRHPLKRLAKEVAYRFIVRQFDGFLSVGRRNTQYLRHYGAAASDIYFVPHFVDAEFFRSRSRLTREQREAERARMGALPEESIALFVGRFVDFKRPLDLLLAVARLRGEGQRFRAVFVGAGPLEQRIRELAAQLAAPVSLLGFRNQSELPALYAAADVLVLPSGPEETWGLVVNEGMCCGVPAVVSDAAGCAPDMIDHGRTGHTFPEGDVEALAGALAATKALLASSELATALRAKTDEFSCERAVAGAVAALTAVVARRRK